MHPCHVVGDVEEDLGLGIDAELGHLEAVGQIRLPSVEAIVQRALDLDTILIASPSGERALLRRYFRDGRIDLVPENGACVGRSHILPLVLLGPQTTAHKRRRPSLWRGRGECCLLVVARARFELTTFGL